MEKKIDGRKNNPNIGRPHTECTPELTQKICDAIATNSASIHEICKKNPDFPKVSTIYEWIAYNKEFSEKYLVAKQRQVFAHVEATFSIADELPPEAYFIDERGNSRIDPVYIAYCRQRIELRKWQAARMMPRLFGDKIHNETTVKVISHEEALKALGD